jgi:hypothetical protein
VDACSTLVLLVLVSAVPTVSVLLLPQLVLRRPMWSAPLLLQLAARAQLAFCMQASSQLVVQHRVPADPPKSSPPSP